MRGHSATRNPAGLWPYPDSTRREFGGLTLHVTNRRHRFYPDRRDPDLDHFAYLGPTLNQRVTPIGWTDERDYPAEIVVANDGRVFKGDWSGVYLLAEDTDWALTRLIRGPGSILPPVSEDGTIHYRDALGDLIDPATVQRPPTGDPAR